MFAAVFGSQAWVPGAAVAVLAVAGLVAAYAVARTLLSRKRAVACVLVVLALPGFALSTSSFMTDVPAFSAEAICLAIAAVALGREGRSRWGLLAAALVVGCFGFSIREFDIAAPLAAIGALGLGDRGHARTYGWAGAGLLAACGAIYLWSAHVPGAQSLPLTVSGLVRFVKGAGNSYFTVSFGLAPLLPAAWRRGRARLSARFLLPPIGALAAGAALLATDHSLFNGNYLLQQGATGAAVLTGRPALFPGAVWWALQLLAVAAGALMAAVAATLLRPSFSPARPSFSPAGPSFPGPTERSPGAAGHFLIVYRPFTVVVPGIYPGHRLRPVPLAPGAQPRRPAPRSARRRLRLRPSKPFRARVRRSGPQAADAEVPRGRRRSASPLPVRVATAALSTVVAAVAAVITLNADAYDAARWTAGNKAVAAGVPATMVDAGFEWVGSHQAGVARPGRRVPGGPFYYTWYDQMFPAFAECAFVSGNDVSLASLRPLATVTYQEARLRRAPGPARLPPPPPGLLGVVGRAVVTASSRAA